MEKITGKKFGDHENPLLVSVRSGARASMPGMMDTILNLGLNEDVVDVIAKKSNNPRWAWDCYRRFIQMYSDVVMEVGKKYFEQLIDQMKERKGGLIDIEASIVCERESHKGIIIGKGGSMLKRIGIEARKEIESMMDTQVNLQLWVKVRKEWRDSELYMKNYGYNGKEI